MNNNDDRRLAMTGNSTIYICPLSQLDTLIDEVQPSHVMTLLSPDTMVDTPASFRHGRHLQLSINDIAAPREGLIAPDVSHISQMLEFVDSWNHDAPMIIHCWAGISRSTAAAYITLCHLNRWDGHETAAASLMRRQARHAQPNRRLVALADQLMGRQGRMISAVEAMGPGEIEFEGMTFTMSARMSAPGQGNTAADNAAKLISDE